MNTVLVLNSGSSSLKYQLLDPESGTVLAVGMVERIGLTGGKITHEVGDAEHVRLADVADHAEALHLAMEMDHEFGPNLNEAGIVAVGHRVVHGGTRYSAPVVIDDDVVEAIRELSPLAPLHNPANLTGIIAARKLFDVPHVAVFDTAFFSTLPADAYTYAINREVATANQIRRYGFHGTSHSFVSAKVAEMLGRDDLRQVVLHLGNGASASAVVNGKAVETSMGLTPLEGLVMGTRSGDIDPAIIFHLHRTLGMTIDELDDLLNKQSGMIGMSGRSDMRDLHDAVDAGDEAARIALGVYCHRLVKYIGAYTAVMGGIDVLVFTAGAGMYDDIVRARVCSALEHMGLGIDLELNAIRSKEARIISRDPNNGGPLVMIVPTNEELSIARQAVAAIA